MLAGARQLPDDFKVRVGGRQHGGNIDAVVVQHRLETIAQGKGKARGKRLPALQAGTDGMADLEPLRQIDEALGVRSDGHAKADQSNAPTAHVGTSTAVPTRRLLPCSVASCR